MSSKKITIIGAGLSGSLMGILLSKRGYEVVIYEKRDDIRKQFIDQGRSINLALSHRGWKALKKAEVDEQINKIAIPMKGRMIHDVSGNLNLIPYGKEDQAIYSVSRSDLNRILIEEAENNGVQFFFNHQCENIDLIKGYVTVRNSNKKEEEMVTIKSDLILGADGAYSIVRQAMQITPRFNYSQDYIPHGYKELTIAPTLDNDFALFPNALHIWPRGRLMLIALPNLDKSFTCTLFLPYEGENSFASLTNEEEILKFFQISFPDALKLMPEIVKEFHKNPIGDLVTIKCFPWSRNEKNLLIGDAAHSIVPFYGQGMNAGFEDCRILADLLEQTNDDWGKVINAFQLQRKTDADAIADLALQNFIEMRDTVADPEFVKRKAIEAKLHELFPDKWIPLYSMVTFSDLRYSQALEIGKKQDKIMKRVMKQNKDKSLDEIDHKEIVSQL